MTRRRNLPFNRIHRRYQLLNSILSGGLDTLWRRRLVTAFDLHAGNRILDVGTGPGDIFSHIKTENIVKVGLDPERSMMEVDSSLDFLRVQGFGEALPFPDGCFDRLTSAFVLRNLSDREAAFSEFHRVLAQGGKGAILEMSRPDDHVIGRLAALHIRHIVPRVGGWISGDRAAYRYLSSSVLAFPKPDAIVRELEAAGFTNVTAERLAGWVTVLYSFEKNR